MRLIRLFSVLFLLALVIPMALPAPALAAVVGTITLSQTSGRVGAGVIVTGTGFSPAATAYSVSFNGNILVNGTVSGGNFTADFNVPTLPGGSYVVTATTNAGDTSNNVNFLITAQITLEVNLAPVGTQVNVGGTGFGSGTTANIYWDGNVLTSIGNDTNGTFIKTITIPNAPAGQHTIYASDGIRGSPNVTYTVQPKIAVASNVTVGQQVTINGSGFAANSGITFSVDSSSVSTPTVTTDGNGSFAFSSFTIPVLSRGSHTISARDTNYNSASASITVGQKIVLTPTSGPSGSTVTIAGNGFNSNVQIAIKFGGAAVTTSPTSVSTDTDGAFTATLVVPPGTTGSEIIEARDGINSATATFSVVATAAISPTQGPAGTTVAINGASFKSSTTVTAKYDTTQVAVVTTDAYGSFNTSFIAPDSPGGAHVVMVTDGVNTVTLAFSIQATFAITPANGAVGSDISARGNGFAAGAPIAVRYDGTQVATALADNKGTFSTSFKVPASAAGNHAVLATDNIRSATATFTVTASANISPVSGNVGADITAKGQGFTATKAVVITYDTLPVANATSDASGAFTVTFKAPASIGGGHTITLSDNVNTIKLPFTVTPGLALSPSGGNVGSNVLVNGTGFAGSRPVTLRYDNTQLAITNTDASGSFAATFSAPASKGGSHAVSASDGVTTLTATFTMDQTPPPVPTLLQPPNDTQASPTPAFIWTPVTDPSGVTYSLQVATDVTFSHIVLDKSGLTTAGYSPIQQEKLPSASRQKPYYWRARAVDGAANESAWAPSQTFYIGFILASWALYVIIAAGVIIVGVGAFWLGRKMGLGRVA